MELKPNMYVRTKRGFITKVTGIDKARKKVKYDIHNNFELFESEIDSYSYNLIDLIEVGDLIETKFDGIVEIIKDNKGNLCYLLADYEPSTHYLTEKDIESIVTHEQFESISYKVD